MLKFYAEKFYKLNNALHNIERMNLEFDLAATKIERDSGYKSDKRDSSKIFSPEKPDFEELADLCFALGLKISYSRMKKIIEMLSKNYSPFTAFRDELRTFQEIVEAELSNRLFFSVSVEEAKYYEQPNLFGENVFNKFPSANFDVEEAGKCFATARFTACVMHLQRVLEVGLKSYGTLLGVASLITAAQPSWNKVLEQTRKEIKERNDNNISAKVWTSLEEKDFCVGVQPFLEAVQIAWRNPSMHADKTYDEEIAEDIFRAVKRFMKHLAEHLEETGKFTV